MAVARERFVVNTIPKQTAEKSIPFRSGLRMSALPQGFREPDVEFGDGLFRVEDSV